MVPPARIVLPITRTLGFLHTQWRLEYPKILEKGEIATVPTEREKWHYMASVEETLTLSLSYVCKYGFVQDCLFKEILNQRESMNF